MDNEKLQKENEKLRLQRGYLIALIVILLTTFSVVQYETLTIGKNAISQLQTITQDLNQLLSNERKSK